MSESKKEEKVDPVQKFYALEDDLARAAGHEKLRDDFVRESGQLRSILEAIVAGESTEPISPSVLLYVANMRRLSRLAQYLTAQKKQETTKYLEQVEAKFLELQNSTSEIQHLQKQVKRCLEFSAGDEDLNMVPEEEFYEKAPESISQPEKTKEDEHARYLARLNWELEQRKELASNLNDHETRRSILLSDIEAKEQRLRNLQPAIVSMIKAAKPVQELLGLQQQQQYEPAASMTPEPAPATPEEPME